MAAIALTYPLIDGLRYSWASITIAFGNLLFLGVKSININEKVDPQKIHGTSQNIIGSTAGQYDADGDIELYQQEADALVSALNAANPPLPGNRGGWMNFPIVVNVQYADDNQPTISKILNVRLTGRTQGGTEGGEAMTSKFTMFFLGPVQDGGILGIPAIIAAALIP